MASELFMQMHTQAAQQDGELCRVMFVLSRLLTQERSTLMRIGKGCISLGDEMVDAIAQAAIRGRALMRATYE